MAFNDCNDWRDSLHTMVAQQAYMLEHGLYSDCTVTVNSGSPGEDVEVFKAHKLILIRASPVFEAMLLGDMTERNGKITITEMSPRTFRALLRHAYTDEMALDTVDEAIQLARAADMYFMVHLRERCCHFIMDKVSPISVWRVLALSDLFNNSQLEASCIKVMQESTLECVEAEDFVTISEDHLCLFLDQEHLEVDSELQLIDATLKWVRKEAENQDLPPDKGFVLRDIMQPKLLERLRFLTLKPDEFASSHLPSCKWLFEAEKHSIVMNLLSSGKVPLVKDISDVRQPRISTHSGPVKKKQKLKKELPPIPAGEFECERPIITERLPALVTDNFEACLTFSTDRDIWLLGFTFPTQENNEEAMEECSYSFFISSDNNSYVENLSFKVMEVQKTGHDGLSWVAVKILRSEKVKCSMEYNQYRRLKLKPLYIQKGKVYCITATSNRRGFYCNHTRSDRVRVGNVDFDFALYLESRKTRGGRRFTSFETKFGGFISRLYFTSEDLPKFRASTSST